MKKVLIILLLLSISGCDNKTEVDKSKEEINQVTKSITDEKEKHQRSIDSLNKEIDNINKTTSQKKMDYASAEIFNIGKHSYLDHVIIGTNEFQKSMSFLNEKLGFSIKNGRTHKNGITNYFVEFEDSSEIEFISIENNAVGLANQYKELLKKDKYAFQFALRTNQLKKLKESFNTLSTGFSEYNENKIYSTLANSEISQSLPFFFIKNHKDNSPSNFAHQNNAAGISAIWIKTKDIKISVRDYIDLGFDVIDTIKVGDYNTKTVLLKNNNFEIILIQSNEFEISGISIKTKNIKKLRPTINEKLNLNLKLNSNKRGTSISLSPKTTKSIWFEFIEN